MQLTVEKRPLSLRVLKSFVLRMTSVIPVVIEREKIQYGVSTWRVNMFSKLKVRVFYKSVQVMSQAFIIQNNVE